MKKLKFYLIDFNTKERRFITELQWFRYCKHKKRYNPRCCGSSHNFKTDWFHNFRNTAFICNSNPLAFNGHHVIFKVVPKLKAKCIKLALSRSSRLWNIFKTRFRQVASPFGNYINRQGTINENLSWWNGQKF